ncbi:MAG: glycosyltransferase [Desulfuromonadales bacterium]|nr:glycosyltransferase [Desulfuromonadales bacterium]
MRYVIVAPTYNQKTAGIAVLQELQKWLIRSGKDAIIPNIDINAPYAIQDDDIVVYPEIIPGNPLNAKRVVRYILNVPGKLGGTTEYDSNEILVAYTEEFSQYSNGVYLEIPIIEDFFTDRELERTVDCVWVGKGQNTHHPATNGCIEITYKWPTKRRELAELLNRTRTFYSYDHRTHLLTEATLCGCTVMRIDGDTLVDMAGHQPLPPGPVEFQRQLDQFIQMTWYPEINSNKEAAEYIETIISSRPPTLAPLSSTPDLTSIIILTWNQLEYTKACLASIRAHTDAPYEIIFVDNGSSDGTLDWLREQAAHDPICRIIENGSNLGFAKGCNQGILAAAGSHIVLLNNDTIVTSGWLTGMRELLDRYPDVGIVGPMTNSASGVQVVADSGYGTLEELPAWAAAFRERNRYQIIRQRRIVGFCMHFRRELPEKIGLLDEDFGSGNFEDDDYCLRAELAGYRNMIAGDVFVHHAGGATFTGNRVDFSQAMKNNHQLFNYKWAPNNLDEATLRRWLILISVEEAQRRDQKGLLNEAVEILIQKGIKADASCKTPYIALTEMLIASGRYDEALQVLAEFPGGTGISGAELEALCYSALGDDGTAARCAERALSDGGSCPRVLVVLGTLAARRGEPGEAEAFFRKAIEADPSCGGGWLSLGMLLWGNGDQDGAYQAVRRAVVVDPLNGEAVIILRDMSERLDHLVDALLVITDAAHQYPDSCNLGRHHAEMLERCGRQREALEACEIFLVRFGVDEELLSMALRLVRHIGLYDRLAEAGTRSVSLCMIVKDEESFLPACLASLKPVVDEMIIVDTGSTDHTVEIATAFGARVYDFTWNGNFSSARNHALSKTKGAWILVMDADEVLSARDYEVLKSMLAQSKRKQVAWSVTTRNYMTDSMQHDWTANSGEYSREERGIGWCPSPKTRLFPNDQRIRFEGPVHEVVEHSLKRLEIPVHQAPFVVHHYGHLDKDAMKSKKLNYYELAKEKLKTSPNDAGALAELAIQAGEVGRFDEALGLWDRVLDIQQNNKQAHFNRSHVLNHLKRYPESIEAAKQALKIDPSMKEAAFYYATGELYVGDLSQAEAELFRIIAIHPAYPPAVALLSVIRLCRGDSASAEEFLQMLKQINFAITSFIVDCIHKLADVQRTELARNLLQLSVQSGCLPKEALTELKRCTVPQGRTETADVLSRRVLDDETLLRAGIVNRAISEAYRFTVRGETDHAVEELLQKGIRVSPDDPAPYLALVDILLTDKRFQDAGQVFPEMPKETPRATILSLQAACREGMGEDDQASRCAAEALEIDPDNVRALNIMGLLSHRRGNLDDAAVWFERAMKASPTAGEPCANRGVMLWTAGEKQAGYELLKRGAQLSPLDGKIMETYLDAAARMGQQQEALGLLSEKLRCYPESRLLIRSLTETLLSVGKTSEALDVLLKALSILGADGDLLDAALELRRQEGPRNPLVGGEPQSVSLCMIVKNEAANLPRCLASVMPVVQEMVIVDTGSSDRTIDIATAFGAQTFNFSWTGNFSDARNFSLSKARGEWILVMDADEVLSAQDHDTLRHMVCSSSVRKEAWSIIVRNYTERINVQGWTANDGLYPSEERADGWYPAQRVKLFPNDPLFCFSGEVHELVEPSLRSAGVAIRTATSFTVHHYGELFGLPEELAIKQRRYFDLGKEKLAERPNDIIALTELAVQAGELEMFDEALALWDRVLSVQPDTVEALFNKSYVLIGMKRYREALNTSRRALELDPYHKEAAFNFGTCVMFCDDPYSAITVLTPVLAMHPDYPLLLALLTVLYLVTNQHDLARTTYTELESLNYAIADYIRDRALELDVAGREDMAQELRKGGMLLGIDPTVLDGSGE